MASVADNVNEIMKTKFNIISVFSAEKLNGNIAKPLLSVVLFCTQVFNKIQL